MADFDCMVQEETTDEEPAIQLRAVVQRRGKTTRRLVQKYRTKDESNVHETWKLQADDDPNDQRIELERGLEYIRFTVCTALLKEELRAVVEFEGRQKESLDDTIREQSLDEVRKYRRMVMRAACKLNRALTRTGPRRTVPL